MTTIDCGTVSDIDWRGPVSAKKMVESGKFTQEDINRAVKQIDNYYVRVNPTAKTRCIDGRNDPELEEDNLGPQIPGGAPGVALAYRLAVDKNDLTSGTFLQDAEKMISTYLRAGLAPGGHRDEYSDGETQVGCGAIDGMDTILETMTLRGLVDDHKRVVKQLLAGSFDRDTYLRVMGAAVVVNDRSEDYFRGREGIINILEKKSRKSVATLFGKHQECIWIINFVPDTTFSSNRFSRDNSGMQAFGYDIWGSARIAEKLLSLRNPESELDRQRFVMARVMTTVATLMALTDGSQRLILRVPADSFTFEPLIS